MDAPTKVFKHNLFGEDATYSEWLVDGKLHRDNGPALSGTDGTEEWYQHGELHRIGGPALIHPNNYQAWYENGIRIREEQPDSKK